MSDVVVTKGEDGKPHGFGVEQLRALLCYDSSTGFITWRSDRICGRGRVMARAGSRAGTQRPSGYRLINLNGTPTLEHRIAWALFYGQWPDGVIDHRNGVPSDNRIANLRDTTQHVNMQNIRSATRGKVHGHLLGASWHASTGKWRALIKFQGKQVSLGYFVTEYEAHNAYLAAKRRLHAGCTI